MESNVSVCYCPGLFVESLINISVTACEGNNQNSFFFNSTSALVVPDSNVTFCNCSRFSEDIEEVGREW